MPDPLAALQALPEQWRVEALGPVSPDAADCAQDLAAILPRVIELKNAFRAALTTLIEDADACWNAGGRHRMTAVLEARALLERTKP